MIISKLTSTKYPNLHLFLLVDKHYWSSQVYHFQFMPHMEEEVTMMMHNLVPVITSKYRGGVKIYFFPEAVEATKDYCWDETLK